MQGIRNSDKHNLNTADHRNTRRYSPLLVNHHDYDEESVEPCKAVVDLNACRDDECEKKDDAHSVKLICDDKEDWTPIIGKGRRNIVACLDQELHQLFVPVCHHQSGPCTLLLELRLATCLIVVKQASES